MRSQTEQLSGLTLTFSFSSRSFRRLSLSTNLMTVAWPVNRHHFANNRNIYNNFQHQQSMHNYTIQTILINSEHSPPPSTPPPSCPPPSSPPHSFPLLFPPPPSSHPLPFPSSPPPPTPLPTSPPTPAPLSTPPAPLSTPPPAPPRASPSWSSSLTPRFGRMSSLNSSLSRRMSVTANRRPVTTPGGGRRYFTDAGTNNVTTRPPARLQRTGVPR